MPSYAPTTGSSADDWWDRLYAEAETAPAPEPRVVAPSRSRIPDWWSGQPVELDPAAESELVADDDQEHDEPEDVEAEEPQDPEAVSEPMPDAPPAAVPAAPTVRKPSGWAPAGAPGIKLNPRAQRLLYNGSAAGLGYLFGFGGWVESAIESCAAEYSVTGSLVLAAGIFLALGLLVDRRTRGWWPPLAWVCRAPLASAVLALCLASF
ncbi:hypothetical protein ACFXKG_40360 [Streptomyces sp. NPDC059255]|uniref:hypothetical protein n=1 Tax=Streptomyces sp. NPDC059255 TaxID=3346793 RepID=UPI0036D06BB0